jgi:histidinol-phosphatase (PHP family)
MEHAINTCFGGDIFAYAKYYFSVCAAAYEKSPAVIAGHLDLLTKFNEGYCQFDEQDPRYLEPAKEALACAVERGMVVELNTGAISRGWRKTPYPASYLLDVVKENGGHMVLGSDSHNLNNLTFHFDESVELLRQAGIDHIAVFNGKGFDHVTI